MKVESIRVKELREKTGAGILSCKQALQQTGGDMEKAIDILRADGAVRVGAHVIGFPDGSSESAVRLPAASITRESFCELT